jgi:glycosyltransferase involved in cell wall biosynthesis
MARQRGAGRALHILAVGLRGLPGVEGGIERHAEELYPRLARLGCRVEVAVRSRFHPRGKPTTWNGVEFKRFWAPETGGLEAFVHTLIVALYAAVSRPDIVHVHAVGPALLTPLMRLFGLRVLVTHHGPDYEREKWGRFARLVLRLGEAAGMRWSNGRIVISRTIAAVVAERYGKDTALIPNGVRAQAPVCTRAVLDALGLTPGRYVLQVSRFVPEKRQLDLINAFAAAGLTGWHLVLVGSLDPDDEYGREVTARAAAVPSVVLTGFRTGIELEELYAHAGLFVLPSSHEGLPIAILEALSHGLRVYASGIPANRDVGLPDSSYFTLGDIEQLTQRLRHGVCSPVSKEESREIRNWVRERFDWDRIARQTLSACRSAAGLG